MDTNTVLGTLRFRVSVRDVHCTTSCRVSIWDAHMALQLRVSVRDAHHTLCCSMCIPDAQTPINPIFERLRSVDVRTACPITGTWCSWLSHSLSMRGVLGSIPSVSTGFAFSNTTVLLQPSCHSRGRASRPVLLLWADEGGFSS